MSPLSRYVKKSTYLTGLPVDPDSIYKLSILYGKLIRALSHLPETSSYRKHTEKIVCDRAQILKTSEDPERIEKTIKCGQMEELIFQAELELQLARKMLIWKPWEPLMKDPPNNQWTWPPIQQKFQK